MMSGKGLAFSAAVAFALYFGRHCQWPPDTAEWQQWQQQQQQQQQQ
jgi:hypothetical protein